MTFHTKIVWISDLHLTVGGTVSGAPCRANLDRIIQQINRHHADAACCIATGDLTDKGDAEEYGALTEALAELAGEVGLDVERAQAVLSGDDFTQHVRDDEALAAEIGVRGVPFFVLDQTLAVQGAQPTEVLVDALKRVLDERPSEVEVVASEPDACGVDGC